MVAWFGVLSFLVVWCSLMQPGEVCGIVCLSGVLAWCGAAYCYCSGLVWCGVGVWWSDVCAAQYQTTGMR